jgi:hypothetical protein
MKQSAKYVINARVKEQDEGRVKNFQDWLKGRSLQNLNILKKYVPFPKGGFY